MSAAVQGFGTYRSVSGGRSMNSKKKIMNGPYLLDPTAEAVTIAWEMEGLAKTEVAYVEENGKEKKVQAGYQHEPVCQEHPTGCYLYTARLEKLQAGTVYHYRILLSGGLLQEADFQTLEAAPESLHLVTLSDSHLFHTQEQFAAMIKQEKPDFILHGGDISFGTGYQHEQYADNWFQKIPEVLASVPVYYIPGNHDDGPFYQEFFASPQAKSVHTADGGYTFSFTYGRTHFTLVDSNSWGLFEMNAVNSGLAADEETRKRITDTLRWVEDDLQSPAARQADWRILMLHHPYTDTFNNRYIVPLAERCGVDLVIGGHLHYYVKSVSVNPEIGARTVYVCQGSTQDPEASLEAGSVEKRLLRDFPEVTGMGRSNYGVLDIQEGSLCYRLYGFSAEGGEKLVDTIQLTHEDPDISLSEIELRRLDNNGRVEIRALAQNNGRSIASVVLSLVDNKTEHLLNLFGTEENNQVVVLEAGEARKLTAIYRAVSPGEHFIRVGDVEEKLVVFEPTQLSYAHMRLFAGREQNADCLFASIEATNNLEREIFTAVPLYINQRIAESRNLCFRGHEKKQIEFCYKFTQGGSYQVSIADQLPQEITIESGIRIIPRIHDKSGHGHTALLHGSPKVIAAKEKTEVCFEGYGDYVEIPSSPDLCAEQGFTGMVWARIDRLARANEMGHNPLMVRGRSVGWGATYFMRMVIERAGGLKWGTCHDITEYSWQGGRVRVGDWMHYTMAFDKKKGGDSYCDGKNVAHVSGIAEQDELRQWAGEPIFVGYSYIGHVIPEIGRPKYFTHLPGRVSQVRFYKSGLSAADNKKIYAAPQEPGPKEKELAVWLDFRDILTVGSHTTEWRHPAVYDPAFKTEKKYWQFRQLKTKARIPLQAGMQALIEVSDDGASVKGSMRIVLKDGTNYLDISMLPKAQYLRIHTDFSAEVGAEGTFVPELQEYQITASNETDFTEMFWSTRPDWEKGTFSGAVGFAPVDRLRDYPEYTDVIHG